MNSVRVVRQFAAVQRRAMSGSKQIFENKNKIGEYRAKWYSNPETGAANPTYLKESGDNVVTGVAITVTILGVVSILNGIKNMSYGINKVQQ